MVEKARVCECVTKKAPVTAGQETEQGKNKGLATTLNTHF